MTITVKVNDIVIWRRASGPVEAKVVEVKPFINGNGQRANLAVKGWVGTTWETIDYSFAHAHDWCPDKKLRDEILHRVHDNIPLSAKMEAIVNQA